MIINCPGQDNRNLKVGILKCPDCGYKVEIFSDEIKVKCSRCKALVCRVRLPSCIDWCKKAQECIGEEKWRQLKGGGNG
ncbi:MAG: phosphohydrolase [Candidatus Omnitrophica bacterium]|nr:phosphohydrolase [Candidatus Omnitrophota bacterium]